MVDVHPGDGPLERYWKYGPGAAKIAWGGPGDFRRCVLQLRKHVGVKAERVCAQWHFDTTGLYPGSHGGKNPNGPG